MINNLKLKEKKILVIGSPGSGKSYFSRQLSMITGIPVYHLDLYYWHEGWVSTPRDEFDKIITDIMKNDEWIIDGNYQRTLEMRLKNANLVFFLDLPTRVCIKAEKERRGLARPDFPSFLNEGEDPEFVKYIKEFPKNNKGIILEAFNKYPNVKVITIKSRKQMDKYLKILGD